MQALAERAARSFVRGLEIRLKDPDPNMRLKKVYKFAMYLNTISCNSIFSPIICRKLNHFNVGFLPSHRQRNEICIGNHTGRSAIND
jgi:hypothetical protein